MRTFALFLLMIITTTASPLSPTLQAQELTPPPSTNTKKPSQRDLAEVCKDYKKKYQPNLQQYEYCAAAEQAQDAAKKNDLLWKVWAGVATICGTYCVANIMCTSANPVACSVAANAGVACTASSISTTIYDAVTTKEFQTIGMSLIGSATSLMNIGTLWDASVFGSTELKSTLKEGEYGPQRAEDMGPSDQANAQGEMGKQKAGDKAMACVPFVTATATTLAKKSSVDSSKKEAESNILAAASLKTPNEAAVFTAGSTQGMKPAGGVASLNPTSGTGGATAAKATLDLTDRCTNAAEVGNSGLAVQCAVAFDKNLSPRITSPEFAKNFQDFSGIPLGGFLSNAKTPSQAIGAGLGQALGSKATEVATAIDAYARGEGMNTLYANQEESTYSAGGGGLGRRGGGDDGNIAADMNQFMQGLLGQLNPEDSQGKGRAPASVLEFKLSQMSPEQVLQAREISLFDRISLRYQKRKPMLSQMRWSTPYNRVSSGQD